MSRSMQGWDTGASDGHMDAELSSYLCLVTLFPSRLPAFTQLAWGLAL